MRQILVGVLAVACAHPHYAPAPDLPLDGDRAARESAYETYRLTADGERLRRADGTYRTLEAIPVLDASPRPHKLFRRHMPLRITSAIVGTIAGIVVVGLIGSAGEHGRLSRNEMIVADSALALELTSLSLSSWLARTPEASELAAAYDADLRERLGLDR